MPDPQGAEPGPPITDQSGPGKNPVGWTGVVVVGIYLALQATIVLYTLIKVWPHPTPAGVYPHTPPDTSRPAAVAAPVTTTGSAPALSPADSTRASNQLAMDTLPDLWCVNDVQHRWVLSSASADSASIPRCVSVFNYAFPIWDEQRLLLIVILAGALGSLLHGLRSVAWYFGNRSLVRSWIPFYVMLPFAGAVLAFLFYVVIRGGFFSPASSFKDTSPFGFAAFAAVVGMFSTQAVLKLKEVAETMLSKPAPGEDSKPQGAHDPTPTKPPSVTSVNKKASAAGGKDDTLEINGADFVSSSQVEINGKTRTSNFVGPAQLTVAMTDADHMVIDNGGDLKVVVVNPGDVRSAVTTVS
jgi:hypothetical protein